MCAIPLGHGAWRRGSLVGRVHSAPITGLSESLAPVAVRVDVPDGNIIYRIAVGADDTRTRHPSQTTHHPTHHLSIRQYTRHLPPVQVMNETLAQGRAPPTQRSDATMVAKRCGVKKRAKSVIRGAVAVNPRILPTHTTIPFLARIGSAGYRWTI